VPLDVDLLNDEICHNDSLMCLDSTIDPMNPNGHHQHVSQQTGLPLVTPNNPPPPPPSVSSGQSSGQNIQMPQSSGPPAQQQHGAPLYPMSQPQIPVATIQYGNPQSFGQVPFLPFNPVTNNFVYGQAVIYQVDFCLF